MSLPCVFTNVTCPAILRRRFVLLLQKLFAIPMFLITLLTAVIPSAAAADLNILLIGSSKSFSLNRFHTGTESGTVHEHAFNPSGIAIELQSILAQDPAVTGTVHVEFDDTYKTKTHNVDYSGGSNFLIENRSHSLAQHYMWPDGRSERLANLRGEGDHHWDYIVLFFDPYILGNFPGMVAEGVKMIQDEVAKSANPAQILLFAQWPWESSIFSVDDYNEVVQRVGSSAGLQVVAGGKAWESYSPKDSVSGTRPTPKGAYLGAAAIYSTIFDRSAKTSSYSFASDGDNIADHALAEVQANASISHFSGKYAGINPFQMKYVTKRVVSFRHTGTSTERGIRDALTSIGVRQRIELTQSSYAGETGERWDFNYGRGNDLFEDEKQYNMDSSMYDRSYGFPMHHYYMHSAPLTMPYGIDKQYLDWHGFRYDDGTDLGIAYNMIRPGTSQPSLPEDVRAVPIRLMWTKMVELSPGFHPLRDNTHMNRRLDDATAAFMYTLLSGRCPVVPEPSNKGSDEWHRWLGHRIGYETAWRMAHLTTRVPGFRVLPSAASATTVTPGPGGTTQTMTVRFKDTPQEDVIVNVSISSSTAAIVGSRTLVFTPDNHAVPQHVTVAGLPGASSSESFEVVFSTSSADEVFDGLGDAWACTNTRETTQTLTLVELEARHEELDVDSSLVIDLGVSGSAAGNTTLTDPSHGTLTWSGGEVVYTPAPGFFGLDGFAFAVNEDGVLTKGYIQLTIYNEPHLVFELTNGPTTVTEGGDADTYTVVLNRPPEEDVIVTLTVDDQVTVVPTSLTFTSSDWNAPQVVTVTAVDDDIHELIHTGTITHTTSSSDPMWDSLSQGFVVIVIDNDNTPPEVDAGPDQMLSILGDAVWMPSALSPAGWYDASDAATLTRDGNAVSEWRDKSGNNLHLAQSDPDRRPRTGVNTINGMTTVKFDGSSDNMVTTSNPFGSVIEDAFVIAVHRHDGTAHGTLFSLSGSSATGSRWQAHVPWGNTLYFDIVNSDNRLEALYGVSVGHEILVSFYGSVTESTMQVFKNGSILANGNSIASVIPSGNWFVGSGSDTQYQDTSIAEMIVINGTVSEEDREKLEGYLAHKWGQAASLPDDHLYKSFAPHAATATAILNGSASDADGDPLVTTWSMVSGPGPVSFGDSHALATPVTFSFTGTYVLRLTAFDGQDTTVDEITITVNDSPDGGDALTFTSDPVVEADAPEGRAYSATLADHVTNSDSAPLTFFKLSGPDWLHVAADGSLTGMPSTSDLGLNSFSVLVTDGSGSSSSATLEITVVVLRRALPFVEDFETLELGDLNGQNGWFASDVEVQGAVAIGSRAAEIVSEEGYLEQSFMETETLVWTELMIKPVFFEGTIDAPLNTEGTTAELYFNAAANPVVFDGSSPVTLSEVTVEPGAWVRVVFRHDYVAKKWSLYVNGTLAAADLDFYDTTTSHYKLLRVQGGGYIDDVSVTLAETVQETFDDWIAGFGLEERAGFNDDYNNDGISNGTKYFFGIDPREPSPGLAPLALDVSEGSQFSFTHPMGEPPAPGIQAAYRWSKDLATFHADGATDEDGTTVSFVRGEPVEGMVTVTATIEGTTTERIFVTLFVTQIE